MDAVLLVILLAVVVALAYIASVNNRSRSRFNGGFLFSPIPFVLINYALIFAYRPFVILYYDAPTLNYAEIDNGKAIWAIQVGLLSLIGFLIPYLVSIYKVPSRRRFLSSSSAPIDARRTFFFYLILSAVVVGGILIYGSALNNTGDRIENPSEYRGFFLFIILQRFHFVLSVLAFYKFLILDLGSVWRPRLLVCLLTAPVLTLIAAGRGGAFYLLIAYGVIYVFIRSVRGSWKFFSYIGFAGLIFSILNFLLSIVRVVISSGGWGWRDVVSALDFGESAGQLKDLLVLASWDYSVFDVFVTILYKLNHYTFGLTNVQYLLSYVPRVLWTGKPLDQGFMLYVTNKFYGDVFSQTGSTFAGTIVGEGYLNFGLVGVFLYSFFFSLMLSRVYKNACYRVDSSSIIIYSLAFPFSQQVVRGGLDVVINFALLILVPLWLLNKVLRGASPNYRAASV